MDFEYEKRHVTRDGRYVVRPGQGGTRLSGHALSGEGRRPVMSIGESWLAHCECGATREVTSAAQAKRWHAKHKGDVVMAGGAS